MVLRVLNPAQQRKPDKFLPQPSPRLITAGEKSDSFTVRPGLLLERHLEGVAMKSIVLPAGTEPVQFGELAHLIADAFYPSTGDDDERMDYGICYLRIEGELSNAVKSGALPVKDAMTLGPHPYPVGNALQTALVTVDDLREFLAGRLDVVAAGTTDQTPDPERRLDLLRVLGGGSKYSRGAWSFTGMAALVESEKGKRRSSEKTIRGDLVQAAQAELDEKKAGFASGLGQR